jgi:ABC-type transport system substrate-binding protein
MAPPIGGHAGDEPGGAPDGAETPRPGGRLTVSLYSPPLTLDPAVAWDVTDVPIVQLVYQGLFRYAARGGAAGLELEPCLAESVPSIANGGISPDGRTITVGLRSGVRFHPPISRTVTAADFVYSIERMMDPEGSHQAPAPEFYQGIAGASEFREGSAAHIAGLEALDELTLRFTLEAPDASFLAALTLDFCDVVPREWVERWSGDIIGRPLGSGPFVFDSWQSDRIDLVRNPVYWERGRPWLDGLTITLRHTPTTALYLLQSGEIDVIASNLAPGDADALLADPAWAPHVVSAPQFVSEYLFLNTRMAPFDDVRVRRAVSWAIDRRRLADTVGGGGAPLLQFYPPGLPGHRAGDGYYGLDRERARALLAEAGYPQGFETSLYTDNVHPDPEVTRLIADDLGRIGIDARVTALTRSTYASMRATPRTLAMGTFGWAMDFPDPVNWVVPLCSPPDPTLPVNVNPSEWEAPGLPEMVRAAQTLTDRERRLEAFGRIQDYLMDQAPYVTLYTQHRATVHTPRVGGCYIHPVYDVHLAELWLRP